MNCPKCGEEGLKITDYSEHFTEYCYTCKYNARREKKTIHCGTCGKEIVNPLLGQLFCSRKCGEVVRNKRRNDRNKGLLPPAPLQGFYTYFETGKQLYCAKTPASNGKKSKRFYAKTEEEAIAKRQAYLKTHPLFIIDFYKICKAWGYGDNPAQVMEIARDFFIRTDCERELWG